MPADGAAGEAGPLALERGPEAVVLRLLRGESLRRPGSGRRDLPAGGRRDRARLAGPPGRPREALDAAKRHIGELSGCCVSGHGRRSAALRCGGRGDERHALRGHGAPLRDPARVSGVGALALGALRPADTRAAAAQGRGARAAGSAPTVSATLLEAIQADLDRSPFQGPSEGPRGILDPGHAGAAGERAHKLLSPHRGRQGTARVHAGTIVTQAPNVMCCGSSRWTTGGAGSSQRSALERGVCGMARVQGWEPVCGARADRPGARRIYGALRRRQRRGLALRMDHGSQYLSDHFLNQIRYWGIRPSYGFVEEPETNGVAERWNRTLKEQATHGRIFQNLKEVRAAVTAWSGTTRPGGSRSSGITRRSRPARRTSYAGRRSVNLCPKNWVRYIQASNT